MTLAGTAARTLEIQPASLAQLAAHSATSGISGREPLGSDLLLEAIDDAAALDFDSLHIGGQSPLACPALHLLCQRAHDLGMSTSITLSQASVRQPLIEELRGSIDLLGVALEGRPASRGRTRRCFQMRLLDAGRVNFAVVFALRRGNLGDLQWAARFAMEHGARMLIVRMAGLLASQLSTTWMVVECMRKLYREKLAIQFEGVNRYNLPHEAFRLQQWRRELEYLPRNLSRIVSRLIIEASGLVAPLGPALPNAAAFGNLRERGLAEMAREWILAHAADFCGMYHDTLVSPLPGEVTLRRLKQFAAAG